MLPVRDLGRNEDREMADLGIDAIDEGLALSADVVDAFVEVEDPAEHLLRRADVVAERGETMIGEVTLRMSNRRPSEVAISLRTSLSPMKCLSTRYWISSPLSWMKSPHHFSKPRKPPLGVDRLVDVVLLAEKGVAGIEVVEIGHQVRAVELAVPEIARERREPRAAEQPPE